jgi:hypothetical protein
MLRLGLLALVCLSTLALLFGGPPTTSAADQQQQQQQQKQQASDGNQTNGSTTRAPVIGQSMAQVSSNMSLLMGSPAAQSGGVMTNGSLPTSSGQQRPTATHSTEQTSAGADRTTGWTQHQQRQQQPPSTNSSSDGVAGPVQSGPSHGATKSQQQHPASRGQQPAAAGAYATPAFNSRQKTYAPGQQQQHSRPPPPSPVEQASRAQRLGVGQHDNQMAADDMHETQALMPAAGQRARAYQDTAPASSGGGGGGNDPGPPASGQSDESAARPSLGRQHAQTAGLLQPAHAKGAASKQQSVYKSSAEAPAGQSAASGGWQTVSTSVPNSSPPISSPAGWPPAPPLPRLRQPGGQSAASQKHLPPPPPPINYNNYYQQQRRRLTGDQTSAFQQQQQQQHLLAGEQLDGGAQLEVPMAGYSYGPSAYTHTARLAPARQELETAIEQPAPLPGADLSPLVGRQRQRQFVPSALEQQQQQISLGAELAPTRPSSAAAPNQLPQFGLAASVHYSGHQQQTAQAAAQQRPASVMAPIGGGSAHSSSPCKPPPLLQLSLQQQQQQQLLLQDHALLANDLAGAATSSHQHAAGAHPIRYVRLGEGTRLKSQFVFKVLRADSLTDCELACSRASLAAGGNPLDTCRSFNYRAYFAAENCELSRSDARQLKLDDGSQFEQHTQFDFYALAHEPTKAQLQQLQLLPVVQQQQVAPPYTPAGGPQDLGDCLDVSQSCSQDGMEFTLRTLEPFTGRIYTYGFYESCYVDGDGQLASTLRISRSNGFPRCGTQQIGDLMTNIVVVQFNDHVQTSRDKKYNLTCYFSGPGEAVVTSSYFDTKLDERSHPMQIEHLPPQNVITSNVQLRILHHGTPTNTIAVGDLLTFRLESSQTTTAGGSSPSPPSSSAGTKQGRANQHERQHEIFATNVIAKDPYSGRQVQLIDGRGCPVDPVNVFPELQRTSDGALESEFYAFKMPDSNFLIFQATVRACKSPCEPVICQQRATPAATGALQQYQMTGSSGVKGGAGHQQLGAYLMAAAHQNAVPSWGRRRRRKRQTGELAGEAQGHDEQPADGETADELLGTGESVEHVIPVRLLAAGQAAAASQPQPARQVVTRVKRPELAEAEQEVKEMFRVYLSRAEIADTKRRRQQAQAGAELDATPGPRSGSLVWTANSTAADTHERDHELREPLELAHQVCLSQAGYYVMLFSIISLSMVVLSVLLVAYYITRQAKFHISETLADALF